MLKKGDIERHALEKQQTIVGVDEVGRGCLAGPVYTAAVVLDLERLFTLSDKELDLIRDSKKLSAKQRGKVLDLIKEIALSYKLGVSSPRCIEKLGILPATFRAMKLALEGLEVSYDKVYVDGNQIIPSYLDKPQEALVKGDSLSYTIAAASIVAKVARDSYMQKQAKYFPEYLFEKHVGYGTKAHLEALELHGVTPLHRRNFAPIRDMIID